ncbi:hypothetical protein D3C80_1546420 [compost metagenome]
MQAQAQRLADRGDHRRGVTGLVLQLEKTPVQGEPAIAQGTQHAHGLDALGVMQVTVGQVSGLLLKATGLNQRFVGQALVEHGQDDQQQRSRTGHDPEPDVEEKNHHQIDGKPGRIEKGE